MWCSDIPIATAGMSRYVWTPELESIYTKIDKFGKKYCEGVRQGTYFDVPRETCPVGMSDERTLMSIPAIDCEIQFRGNEQAEVVSRSVGLFLKGKNHVLEAPTGFGKTIVGTAIANRLNQATLVIVTKNDLVSNWIKAFKIAGISESEIGHVQGSKKSWKGKRFVVGMVQSLIIPGKYPDEFYKYFGLTIFDETHRMGAESFVKACQLFTSYYRLGLSATPNRSDGKMSTVHNHIGPTLVRGLIVPMTPKVVVKKTGWNIPKRSQWNGIEYVEKTIPFAPGRMMGISKLQGADEKRNEIIVDFVRQAYNAGRNIVVMSDLIEGHLNILFRMLAKVVPVGEIGFYVSGKKHWELNVEAHKRVVLATYGMCSEGTDFPHWDTLVLATPRANVKQPVGRILRTKEGKKTPVVLDLVDGNSIFHGFYLAREKQYFQLKAQVVKL